LLGSLTAGLCLLDASPGDADVAFVDSHTAEAAVGAGVPDTYAISAEFAARGFGADAPTGTSDYVSGVRPQADAWAGVQFRAGDADPCLAERTRAEVVETARERAEQVGLSAGARALTTRSWTRAADWIDTVLAPLAVGGSIVIVANCVDEDVLQRRMAQERASVRI
jgi:hypothetical protein